MTTQTKTREADKPFNWDRHIAETSYTDVMARADKANFYPPTMYSPDGRLLYLSSIDIAVSVDDVEMLRGLLDDLMDSLHLEIGHFNWCCQRAAAYTADYVAVWKALECLGALPDDYRFPEYYLEMAWRERKPVVRHTRGVPLEAPAR